jgi:3D (Asp-Asp-Asp) domain-containing protein
MKSFRLQGIKYPKDSEGRFINKYSIFDQLTRCLMEIGIGTFIVGFVTFGIWVYFNTPNQKGIVTQVRAENATTGLVEAHKGVIREVTAYNVGDPSQTDGSPCISANGENICNAIAQGYKRCAANFVPLGTDLYIQNYGECKVVDRMNSRYQNRVDISFGADEKERAIKFGLQNLLVVVK